MSQIGPVPAGQVRVFHKEGTTSCLTKTGRWRIYSHPGTVQWVGARSGVRWSVDVDIGTDGVPRVTRFIGEPPEGGQLSKMDDKTLAAVEFEAVAHLSNLVEDDAPSSPFSKSLCSSHPRSWRYYVRQVMTAEHGEPTRVDYAAVAEAVITAGMGDRLAAVKEAVERMNKEARTAAELEGRWPPKDLSTEPHALRKMISRTTAGGWLAPSTDTRSPRVAGPRPAIGLRE